MSLALACLVLGTALPALAAPPAEPEQAQFAETPNPYTGLALLNKLVQTNRIADAKALADDLVTRFDTDPQVWAQIGYLRFQWQAYPAAQASFSRALALPGWTLEQRNNLRRALANSALAAGDAAVAVQALRDTGIEQTFAGRLELGKAQIAAKDRKGAAETARAAASIARTVGEREDAEALMQAAIAPASDARADRQLNLGYAYLRQGEDAKGLESFERGFAMGSGKAFHYADAAYAAKRLGDNDKAASLFKFALDLDSLERSFSPQRTYGFQREVETMERRWGVLIGSPYHAGALDVWQAGVEAFWQPPVIGYRDGRILQFFTRAFLNFRNGKGGPIGFSTLQESLGVRYKPLATQNIVLTAERLLAVGPEAENDWLFRIGYSTGAGTDRRMDATWWSSWQIYAEAAYYLFAQRVLIGTEVRYGVVWPVPRFARMTVYPHALLAVELDTAAATQLVNALGPGLALRMWFGEDRYHAPPGWLEIAGSWRFADAERAAGPGVRATLSF